MPKNYFKRSGLTLIEVIASTALLSTLLVGSLLAFTKHTHAIRRDTLKLTAISKLEPVVASWFSGGRIIIPQGAQMPLSLDPALYYKTYRLSKTTTPSSRLDTIRVEVFETNPKHLPHGPLVVLDLASPRFERGEVPTP